MLMPLPWLLRLLLACLAILLSLRERAQLTKSRGLLRARDGSLFWRGQGAAEEQEIHLSGEQVLWPWLVTLKGRVCETGERFSLVLGRDSVSRDDWHYLHGMLRW